MAIFFSCLCGQNLREEDHRAGSQMCCSTCGLLVAIPFPRRAPAAVPDTSQIVPPAPSLELRAVEVPAPPCEPSLRRQPPPLPPQDEEEYYPLARESNDPDPDESEKARERARSQRLLSRAVLDLNDPRFRRRWPLEKHWFEFLSYPLRALPLALILAMAWATLIAILSELMPDRWYTVEILACAPLLMITFMLFGYTVALLQGTYAAARAGKAGFLVWPGRNMTLTVRGGVQGLLAFLAGPVVPAVVGYIFWVESGELQTIDWLILWDLGLAAVGYWALALLAVQEDNRLRDLHPAKVMNLARQIGFRAPLFALLIALPVVGKSLQTLGAFDRPGRSSDGWLLLVMSWTGQLAWMLLLLRWFGVSRFRAVDHAARQASNPERTTA